MRVTRDLVTSLGASGCIAAAGACALLALSATIGFRGWPGLDGAATSTQTIRAAGAHATPPRRHIAATHLARHAAAGRRLAATEARSDLPSTPAASTHAGAGSTTHRGTADAKPTSAPAATPTAAGAPAPQGSRTASTTGQAVRATGDRVGGSVAPASPTAAQTVTNATDAAGDAVDRVGGGLP